MAVVVGPPTDQRVETCDQLMSCAAHMFADDLPDPRQQRPDAFPSGLISNFPFG